MAKKLPATEDNDDDDEDNNVELLENKTRPIKHQGLDSANTATKRLLWDMHNTWRRQRRKIGQSQQLAWAKCLLLTYPVID